MIRVIPTTRFLLHLLLAFASGYFLNFLRPQPLPLIYASEEERILAAIAGPSSLIANAHSGTVEAIKEISLNEMEHMMAGKAIVLIDARTSLFYDIGHIPSAFNLPRSEFSAKYKAFLKHKHFTKVTPVIVYCSSSECDDSLVVAKWLTLLGYSNVAVFRGGWREWDDSKNN